MISKGKNEGRIELILGPVFSGKSTRLIELIRKYTYNSKKTIMVKYFQDDNNSEKSELITHDLTKYVSLDCKNLRESFNVLESYDVIGIDEGQFFSDLVEVADWSYSKKLLSLQH